ncbi:alpha-L-rhamnosidase N-terminal domain-containing protein [candidate division KSB1 bacterium]|nr:alpha-L-rhamnosidase N-terminal domain-containing protein [candidate division KSB1 bacterium]
MILNRFLFFSLLLFVRSTGLLAQETASQVNNEWENLRHSWQAQWINHPEDEGTGYGVFHFRRNFQLETKPEQFLIYVSADNRYRLYVNGVDVCHGPARGDLLHWRYETIDVAAHLKKGKNTIAALVYNFGIYKPVAQHSYRTAFILQVKDKTFQYINTDGNWKVYKNPSYFPIPVGEKTVHGFYAVCPGDSIDGRLYPWNWQQSEFDDSLWSRARLLGRGVGIGYMHGEPWYLFPRNIPFMEQRKDRLQKLRRAKNVHVPDDFVTGNEPLLIPVQTHSVILFDRGELTMGYPELKFNKGKNSKIKITYCEALFDFAGRKGHRDDITGRSADGIFDVIIGDGGFERVFRPLWMRTFRYLELDIQTADDPLIIEDIYNIFTAYPFSQNAAFTSDRPELNAIWQTGWRTARLCALETYYDCPYYEQLQYIGDTRIQALISMAVSGDDRLARNALELFDNSRVSDGITQSRYPSAVYQFIPPFSLIWIYMIHDYYMYREDLTFIQSFIPGMNAVLDFFERHLDFNGLLSGLEWFNFVDWADEYSWGVPPGVDTGHSALASLQYVYALQKAADIYNALNQIDRAERCSRIEERIRKAVRDLCYDNEKQLFTDTPHKRVFSQHTNIMAVLTNTAKPGQQQKLIKTVLTDSTLVQCTMYFRFYLFRALKKTGLGDLYTGQLGPWRRMLEYGFTTFGETDIGSKAVVDSRSDCHAWSASPNFDFLTIICGIEPAQPGFKSVIISPALGEINKVTGQMPTPEGLIKVAFTQLGKKREAIVDLPAGVKGELHWAGQKVLLTKGWNEIAF